MAKVEFILGPANSRVKVIVFASATCTDCAGFLLSGYNLIREKAVQGKLQLGLYPFILGSGDELGFGYMGASGVTGERAFMGLAELRIKSRTASLSDLLRRRFNDVDQVVARPSYGVARDGAVVTTKVALNLWKITAVPAVIVNGMILRYPERGTLLRDVMAAI
jgi:hypothetical protein